MLIYGKLALSGRQWDFTLFLETEEVQTKWQTSPNIGHNYVFANFAIVHQ